MSGGFASAVIAMEEQPSPGCSPPANSEEEAAAARAFLVEVSPGLFPEDAQPALLDEATREAGVPRDDAEHLSGMLPQWPQFASVGGLHALVASSDELEDEGPGGAEYSSMLHALVLHEDESFLPADECDDVLTTVLVDDGEDDTDQHARPDPPPSPGANADSAVTSAHESSNLVSRGARLQETRQTRQARANSLSTDRGDDGLVLSQDAVALRAVMVNITTNMQLMCERIGAMEASIAQIRDLLVSPAESASQVGAAPRTVATEPIQDVSSRPRRFLLYDPIVMELQHPVLADVRVNLRGTILAPYLTAPLVVAEMEAEMRYTLVAGVRILAQRELRTFVNAMRDRVLRGQEFVSVSC